LSNVNGYKGWIGLWTHEFELAYDDIKSVKQHKYGLTIRSETGRYVIIVHNPQCCASEISKWKYKHVDSEDAGVDEKAGDTIDVIANHIGGPWLE